MRIGLVILPTQPWARARAQWRLADEMGFDSAWTYDHLRWAGAAGGRWHEALTTLAAAAVATSRIRLGTMVTSPNFRHPVLTAKAVVTLDEVSGGRFDLGVGAGGLRSDAGVLGMPEWEPRERAERFVEWVHLADALLRQDETTFEGRYYSASAAPMTPGCVQSPRVPFTIAATGPRAMRVVARYGDSWVTYGEPVEPAGTPLIEAFRRQSALLEEACAAESRDPGELGRVLLTGVSRERPLASAEAFTDVAGLAEDAGVTDLLLHWPEREGRFAGDLDVLEEIAAGRDAGANQGVRG